MARTRWLRHGQEFHDDGQLEQFRHWLEALPERSWTLLELALRGQLSLAARAELDALLDDYAERLACLRVSEDAVTVEPAESDLHALAGEGFVGEVVEDLRAGHDPADDDALRLLYRLTREVG